MNSAIDDLIKKALSGGRETWQEFLNYYTDEVVVIKDLRFKSNVFSDMEFLKTELRFEGCTFENGSFENATFDCDKVAFEKCEFYNQLSFENAKFQDVSVLFYDCNFLAFRSFSLKNISGTGSRFDFHSGSFTSPDWMSDVSNVEINPPRDQVMSVVFLRVKFNGCGIAIDQGNTVTPLLPLLEIVIQRCEFQQCRIELSDMQLRKFDIKDCKISQTDLVFSSVTAIDFGYFSIRKNHIRESGLHIVVSDIDQLHISENLFTNSTCAFSTSVIRLHLDMSTNIFDNRPVTMKDIALRGDAVFSFCEFRGGLGFESVSFNTPPDLTQASITGPFSTEFITIKDYALNSTKSPAIYRRLRDLATTIHDHDRETLYLSLEMKAKRHQEKNKLLKGASYLYDILSDYGRSVGRPAGGLAGLWGLCIGIYSFAAYCENVAIQIDTALTEAALLSISTMLPFIPSSKALLSETKTFLFNSNAPAWVDALMVLQGGLSFVLLFLLGLGLRNRFKL